MSTEYKGLMLLLSPVVANGVFLSADVHELSGNAALLLTLPHQSLHQLLLATLLLPISTLT